MGKERPEQGGAKQAERKVKGKKKRGGERVRALGGVGETPERRVGHRGPSRGGGIQTPGGGGGGGTVGGGRQAAPETTKLYRDPRLFPGASAERSWSLAWPRLTSPRGPGQGRPPTPPQQCLPTPLPSAGTRGPQAPLAFFPRRPTAPPPRCPGTPAADPRDPVPGPSARSGARPGGHGGSSPKEAGPGREGGGRGRGAARVSHLFSWPRRSWGGRDLSRSAFSSCFMEPCAWVGAPERSGPASGPDARHGRGGAKKAGGRAEEEAAGRRWRQGRTARGIPRAPGGLSLAGTRVLQYPSSHRRQ